jgi:hypothetical protein
LREDRDALPPPGLDPGIARFARDLVRNAPASPADEMKARVWQRALNTAQHRSQAQQEEGKTMQAIRTLERKPLNAPVMTWAIAAIITVLIGAVALVALNMRGPDSDEPIVPGAAVQQEDESPTVPAPRVTASPSPITGQPTAFPPTSSPISPMIQDPAAYVAVVTLFVPVDAGEIIREDMLTVVLWPQGQVPSGSFTDVADVIGKYAARDMERFLPVLDTFILDDQMTATPVPSATTTPTFTPTFTLTPVPSATTTPTPTQSGG